MRFLLIPVVLVLCAPTSHAQALNYPEAARSSQVDVYHGIEVPDPYRWMESIGTPELTAWARAQDNLTAAYLASEDYIGALADRVDRMTRTSFRSVRARYGEWYFDYRRDVEGNFANLFAARGEGPARLLLDIEGAREEDVHVAGAAISPKGSRMVVLRSEGPSRWKELLIMDTATGTYLNDSLTGIYSGGSATAFRDEDALYYVRYEVPEDPRAALGRPALYLHRLGTAQSEDIMLWQPPSGVDLGLSLRVTDDGRWLVMEGSLSGGTFNGMNDRVWLLDHERPGAGFRSLFDEPSGTFSYEAQDGSDLIFRSTVGAANGHLVRVDPETPANVRVLLPEAAWPIQAVTAYRRHLLVHYVTGTESVVRFVTFGGELTAEVKHPTTNIFGIQDDPEAEFAEYGVTTLMRPAFIYRMDFGTGRESLVFRPDLPYDPDDYVTETGWATSADGTQVPVSLVRRTNTPLDGTAPVFLYGYGAWGWSAFPWQQYLRPWVEMGGVYAIAHVRGGGEYGPSWHEAGIRRNKENTIADFIAAGEWLVAERITSPERLVANGGSASGMLPAVAVNRRPDLFGAAVIDYPTLDILRAQHFGSGALRIPEIGDVEVEEDFRVMRGYSPVHNVASDRCYPPVFVQVGSEDETTTPMHGYKYAAVLQGAQSCSNPVLLKVAWGAGHSNGKTPADARLTQAQQMAFLIKTLALPRPDFNSTRSAGGD